MRYVIASAVETTLNACRDFVGAGEGLEFRTGSVSRSGWDCQAAVVNFALAHDRYGGMPVIGSAQVLVNGRGDGAPEIILATPPLPLAAASNSPTDADVESRVLGILRSCITAYVDRFGESAETKVLIHLEAAGIDRPDLTPTLRAIADFLGPHR